MKRIKLTPKKPNPLFELWLEEWRDEAASRNSDLQYYFSKALASLKKYPLPLKSGKDCIILQNFGTKLCSMLDRKLEDYKAQNNDFNASDLFCINCNPDKHILKRKCKSQEIITDLGFGHQRIELEDFDDINLPLWDLENYAVLLVLYKETLSPCFSGYVTEEDLFAEIKKLCGNASKIAISNAFNCGLISMIGAPIRYNLTEHGINISKKICEVAAIDVKIISSSNILTKIQTCIKSGLTQMPCWPIASKHLHVNTASTQKTNNDTNRSLRFYKSKSVGCITTEKNNQQCDKSPIKESSKQNGMSTEKTQERGINSKTVNNNALNVQNSKNTDIDTNLTNIYLESGKFDIILLVDTHETSGGKTKPQYDATLVELSELGVLFEIRHLKVGDFAWIARCRKTNNELVIPYIVERKRIDDLSASITDGRFHEQKFRLKQSGILNLMYIIEEYDKGQRLAIPHSSLMQASINTLIQDGFSIKYTKTHKDSMFYLSSLSRILIKVFKDKNLIGCRKEDVAHIDISSTTCNLMEFQEFNKSASKQKVFQVNQMFVRQLLQLKGLSVEKAAAIVDRYPTPRVLLEAFKNCDTNRELLLANIEYGEKKRSIGPAISRTIYQLYTEKNLN